MLDHRGDSSHRGRGAAGGEVFAAGIARVHEVHVGVHHPGQNQQAGRVHLLPGGPPVRGQGGHAAVADVQVRPQGPRGRDHGTPQDGQVHQFSRSSGWSPNQSKGVGSRRTHTLWVSVYSRMLSHPFSLP